MGTVARSILFGALFFVAGCATEAPPEATWPETARSPFFDPLNFVAAHKYIRKLGDKFDITRECIPGSIRPNQMVSYGERKFACALIRYPQMVLLIAKTPEDDEEIVEEPVQLRNLSNWSMNLGRPVPIAMIDRRTFHVPCVALDGKRTSSYCAAVLRKNYVRENYVWWRWWFELDQVLTTHRTDDVAAVARACSALRSLSTFFGAGGRIALPQGFVGVAGAARGEFVIVDPRYVRQPSPGARDDGVHLFENMRAKYCGSFSE